MIMRIFSDYWSFACFLLLLIFMGLFYQVAFQYPAIDGFPLIERLINNQYLVNDFFTNTFKEFSPRLASAKLIVWLSQLFEIDYQWVVAYANIIRIWLYGIGLYLLFANLAGRAVALLAFAFSSLSFLSMPFLPAWWPITYDLTSSNIALVFAMFAWVYAVRNNVHAAFLLLTFAVIVHPVVGVQALLVSILIYLARNSMSDLLALFKVPSIYPFAIAFTLAFLFNYLSYEQVLSDQEFISINGHFRHGHHFIFSHMDIEKWLSTLLMITLCLIITYFLRHANSSRLDRLSYSVIAYAALMTVLSYLFAELYPTRFMISFIPMRGFPILVPIIILAFARLAYLQWQQQKFCNFFLLFLPFLPYNHLGLTWFLLPNHHQMVLPMLITLFAMVVLLADAKGVMIFNPIDKLIIKLIPRIPMALLILPIGLAAFALSLIKFTINIPSFDNQPDIYQWLNIHTDKNDVVLTELNAADNQKLRLLARRAVIVSKDFPFNELFYKEWYQRYQDTYLHRDDARGRIDQLGEKELNNLMDKYSAQILLRTKILPEPVDFNLIGKTQGEKSEVYIYRHIKVTNHE